VCTSEVQIIAAVVRTIASSGPGSGMGLFTTPVSPAFFITNARMVSVIADSFAEGRAHRTAEA
jgi:hypothetical protein